MGDGPSEAKRRRVAASPEVEAKSYFAPYSDGYRARRRHSRKYSDEWDHRRRRRRGPPDPDLISTAPPVSGGRDRSSPYRGYRERRSPPRQYRYDRHNRRDGDEWWVHILRRRRDKRHRPRKQYSGSFTRSCKPAKPGVPPPEVDRDKAFPHIEWKVGMMLNSSLQVVGEIAEGTFGRVLECKDLDAGTRVAVKVVRASEDYSDAALQEAEILQTLNKMDPENTSGIVRLYGTFRYEGRVCLVMERLGRDLYEFSSKYNCVGFALSDIKSIAYDLVKTLAFFKRAGLTHTDLKLENMVLINDEVIPGVPGGLVDGDGPVYSARPKYPHVKIIDFGGAVWNSENQNFLVNTRQYRAPEVILDLGWTEACDVWCLGCSLAELYTGQLVFQTHGHLEHLAMIEKIIGPIPLHMLQRAGSQADDLVDRDRCRVAYPDAQTSSSSIRNVNKLLPLEATLEGAPESFISFVSRMLTIDPELRATPNELLNHPFLASKNSSSKI